MRPGRSSVKKVVVTPDSGHTNYSRNTRLNWEPIFGQKMSSHLTPLMAQIRQNRKKSVCLVSKYLPTQNLPFQRLEQSVMNSMEMAHIEDIHWLSSTWNIERKLIPLTRLRNLHR